MQSTGRQCYAPAFHIGGATAAAPTESDEPLLLASATVVSGNMDLVAEILLRLPIKSLAIAKTVSRQWLSLIESSYFSRLRNPKPNLPSGLFFRPPPTLQLFYVPLDANNYHKYDVTVREALAFFNEKNPDLSITQSCNGFLLCGKYLESKSMYEWMPLYVVNPTTRQLRAIPPFSPGWRCWGATLAYDPSKSPHYKLVALYHEIDSVKNYEIAIYYSKTSEWRMVSDFPMALSFKDTDGVFWNGAINWFSRSGKASVYFKVEEESLHSMPMPPIPPGMESPTVRYFGEYRGHLYLAILFLHDRHEGMEFTIYEMKRDYSSWFVKHSVQFNEFVAAFPDMEYYLFGSSRLGMVVGMENAADDDGEWLLVALHKPYKVVSYNFKHKKFEEISRFSYVMSSSSGNIVVTGLSKFYPYIESLSHV